MTATNPIPSLSRWFAPVPAGSPSPKLLRAIGLVGAGQLATGIAHWCATKGFGVIMHDKEAATLTHSVEVIRGLFRTAVARHEITAAEAHKAMGGIGITTSVEDMEFCDMVIETIEEDAAAKRARFAELARLMPQDSVLASCASEADLEELFVVTTEPGRVIGLSFSEPVDASREIQVIIGSQTGHETAVRVLTFSATLDKTPVVNGKARCSP